MSRVKRQIKKKPRISFTQSLQSPKVNYFKCEKPCVSGEPILPEFDFIFKFFYCVCTKSSGSLNTCFWAQEWFWKLIPTLENNGLGFVLHAKYHYWFNLSCCFLLQDYWWQGDGCYGQQRRQNALLKYQARLDRIRAVVISACTKSTGGKTHS